MRKQIITVIIGLFIINFMFNKSFAQTNTAQTNINITLVDVISIDNESTARNGIVNFNYNTVNDYNSSQTHHAPNSIIVISTKTFDVKVKANGEFFTDGINDIPINVLVIKPGKAGRTTMGGSMNDVILSTVDQNIVSNAPVGYNQVLELDYEIPESKSASPDILGKPAGTYSQIVTYSAVAL